MLESLIVIPVKTGIQDFKLFLDARLREHDGPEKIFDTEDSE